MCNHAEPYLGRERTLERLDRHRLSGLRVADELAGVLLRDTAARQQLDLAVAGLKVR